MKKKIVGILVMTLLIATVFPAVGAMNSYNIYPMTGEVKDQYQEWSDECIYIDDYEWQEFVPTLAKHTRVEVKIVHWFSGSPALKLSIEKPLGTVLRYKELPAILVPGDAMKKNAPIIHDERSSTGIYNRKKNIAGHGQNK